MGGIYKQGIEFVKKAISKEPKNSRFHYILGNIYANRSTPNFSLAQAEREFILAIRSDLGDSGPHGQLYHIYYESGRYDEAEKEFLKCKSMIPKRFSEGKSMKSYEEMILRAIAKKKRWH